MQSKEGGVSLLRRHCLLLLTSDCKVTQHDDCAGLQRKSAQDHTCRHEAHDTPHGRKLSAETSVYWQGDLKKETESFQVPGVWTDGAKPTVELPASYTLW